MIQFIPIVHYLAGPYSGDIPENIRRAQVVAGAFRKQGYVLIVPHNESIGNESALTEPQWLAHGKELVKVCGGIILMPGWEKSKGTRDELDLAILRGTSIWQADWSPEDGWYVLRGSEEGVPWPANQ